MAVKLNPLYLYICIRQIGNLREHPAYFAAASNPFFTSVSDADVTVHVRTPFPFSRLRPDHSR